MMEEGVEKIPKSVYVVYGRPKGFFNYIAKSKRSIKKHKILNLNEEFYLPFLFVACQ